MSRVRPAKRRRRAARVLSDGVAGSRCGGGDRDAGGSAGPVRRDRGVSRPTQTASPGRLTAAPRVRHATGSWSIPAGNTPRSQAAGLTATPPQRR
jgi:hypothetical protein